MLPFFGRFFPFSFFSVADLSVNPVWVPVSALVFVDLFVSGVLCELETKSSDERDQHGRSLFVGH